MERKVRWKVDYDRGVKDEWRVEWGVCSGEWRMGEWGGERSSDWSGLWRKENGAWIVVSGVESGELKCGE